MNVPEAIGLFCVLLGIKLSCPVKITCMEDGFKISALGIPCAKVPWAGIRRVESTRKGWKMGRGPRIRYLFYYNGAFLRRPLMVDFNECDPRKAADFWSTFKLKTGGLEILKGR